MFIVSRKKFEAAIGTLMLGSWQYHKKSQGKYDLCSCGSQGVRGGYKLAANCIGKTLASLIVLVVWKAREKDLDITQITYHQLCELATESTKNISQDDMNGESVCADATKMIAVMQAMEAKGVIRLNS